MGTDIGSMTLQTAAKFTASTGVVQAYESLAILEGTSSLAQQALQSGAKLKLEDTHNLNAYFNKVNWVHYAILQPTSIAPSIADMQYVAPVAANVVFAM